jgi:hypothetical protein
MLITKLAIIEQTTIIYEILIQGLLFPCFSSKSIFHQIQTTKVKQLENPIDYSILSVKIYTAKLIYKNIY